MKIVTPSDEFKFDVVNGIINTVGRSIDLSMHGDSIDCPTCSGSDAYCLTCSGYGYISDKSKISVIASILWASSENTVYTKAGQFIEGDCVVILPYEKDLQEKLSKTQSVIVDNRSCVIDKWVVEGSPVNRIRVILKEDESPYQKQ